MALSTVSRIAKLKGRNCNFPLRNYTDPYTDPNTHPQPHTPTQIKKERADRDGERKNLLCYPLTVKTYNKQNFTLNRNIKITKIKTAIVIGLW